MSSHTASLAPGSAENNHDCPRIGPAVSYRADRSELPAMGTVPQATTLYTWNTSAYSRFTLIPCVRATLRMYSGSA